MSCLSSCISENNNQRKDAEEESDIPPTLNPLSLFDKRMIKEKEFLDSEGKGFYYVFENSDKL